MPETALGGKGSGGRPGHPSPPAESISGGAEPRAQIPELYGKMGLIGITKHTETARGIETVGYYPESSQAVAAQCFREILQTTSDQALFRYFSLCFDWEAVGQ